MYFWCPTCISGAQHAFLFWCERVKSEIARKTEPILILKFSVINLDVKSKMAEYRAISREIKLGLLEFNSRNLRDCRRNFKRHSGPLLKNFRRSVKFHITLHEY